jgi:hypothetical protein
MGFFGNDPEDVTPEEILEWCGDVDRAFKESFDDCGRPIGKVSHRLSLGQVNPMQAEGNAT